MTRSGCRSAAPDRQRLTGGSGPAAPGSQAADARAKCRRRVAFEGAPGANYGVLRRRRVTTAADTIREADCARSSSLPDEAPPVACGSSDRAMNDHPSIESETSGGSGDHGRLRHPPERLLPLMRTARPTAALQHATAFGRHAISAPRSSRWAGPQRHPLAVESRSSAMRLSRPQGSWPLSWGGPER